METSTLTCPSCKNTCFEPDIKCEICGFPLKGTDKEKGIFIGQKYAKKQNADDSTKAVKTNQVILYIVGGLNIIFGFFYYLSNKIDVFGIIITLVIGLAFIGLALLAKIQPLISFIVALSLLLGLYFLNYLGDPSSLIRGILWKIIIVGCLIYGIARSIENK